MATVKNETDFVFNAAVAVHGDGDGIRHSGDGLEISTDRLFATGDGGYVFWDRPDRRNDSCGGVAEAAAGDLDGVTVGLAEGVHVVLRFAADLRADISIGEGHGGV